MISSLLEAKRASKGWLPQMPRQNPGWLAAPLHEEIRIPDDDEGVPRARYGDVHHVRPRVEEGVPGVSAAVDRGEEHHVPLGSLQGVDRAGHDAPVVAESVGERLPDGFLLGGEGRDNPQYLPYRLLVPRFERFGIRIPSPSAGAENGSM